MENHHNHEHGHDHIIEGTETEKNDMQKLSILLVHWIEHNKAHQENFELWAKKAENMNRKDTAEYIKKAVEFIEKANAMLTGAKESL